MFDERSQLRNLDDMGWRSLWNELISPASQHTSNRSDSLLRGHITICNDTGKKTSREPRNSEEWDRIKTIEDGFINELRESLDELPLSLRDDFAFHKVLVHHRRVIPLSSGGCKVAFVAEVKNRHNESLVLGPSECMLYKEGPVFVHVCSCGTRGNAFECIPVYSFAAHTEELVMIESNGTTLAFGNDLYPPILNTLLERAGGIVGKDQIDPHQIVALEALSYGHSNAALFLDTDLGRFRMDVPLKSQRWTVEPRCTKLPE